MKVIELIHELNKYPDNMDVFMDERKTEFTFGLVNSVRKQKINFKDNPYGEVIASDYVIILDEE
jgi:hypothetical protein